jgi:hypothetical protein
MIMIEETKSLQDGKMEIKRDMSFLMKLYSILESEEYNHIIDWGGEGKYFIVKKISEFTEQVLPKFFKHSNFASFVRQVKSFFNSIVKHV